MKIERFEFTQLAKYLSLGGLGAGVDSMVFVILNQVGVRPVIANTISTLFGIAVSYGLNSKYTFNQNQYSRRSATKFLIVGLFGLVFSNITLWLLIEILDMKPI